MSATLTQPFNATDHVHVGPVALDTGARLSRALLSYLVVLITALQLMPFQFAMPREFVLHTVITPISGLLTFAMFVPYGFLTRRARVGRVGRHMASIVLSAAMLSLALETAQLFQVSAQASLVHVLTAAVGAALGSALCQRVTGSDANAHHAVNALLLQLPLMGLVYLLIPLLWATGATANGDSPRLILTLCVGLMGATILGFIARAIRGHTPERAPWMVAAVVGLWISVGIVPSMLADWRMACGIIAIVTLFGAWLGRWSAPVSVERRFEVPSLTRASIGLGAYFIGAGIWPGHSFRSYPLMSVGVPTSETGMALVLPLLEAGIAGTVLGYVIAELRGREEAYFRDAISQVMFWVAMMLITSECMRAFFGYEGASIVRGVLSLGAAAYGAGLYHLQRSHVKVFARRVRSPNASVSR
jgi:glycopeptide antibiotics resistance protein